MVVRGGARRFHARVDPDGPLPRACYAGRRVAKVISLGKARKARQRDEARARADANAIRHGRTKAERAQQALEEQRRVSVLDGARLEPTDDAGEADAARTVADDDDAPT